MESLKRRAAFKAVAAGKRVTRSGFVLQALAREKPVPGVRGDLPRFGFTVTRKIGNAVVRNHVRRRLREAVKQASAPNPRQIRRKMASLTSSMGASKTGREDISAWKGSIDDMESPCHSGALVARCPHSRSTPWASSHAWSGKS